MRVWGHINFLITPLRLMIQRKLYKLTALILAQWCQALPHIQYLVDLWVAVSADSSVHLSVLPIQSNPIQCNTISSYPCIIPHFFLNLPSVLPSFHISILPSLPSSLPFYSSLCLLSFCSTFIPIFVLVFHLSFSPVSFLPSTFWFWQVPYLNSVLIFCMFI